MVGGAWLMEIMKGGCGLGWKCFLILNAFYIFAFRFTGCSAAR